MSIFKHKKSVAEPQPFTVPGVPSAPITPEPDDAEIAAQALLELMLDMRRQRRKGKPTKAQPQGGNAVDAAPHNKQYYIRLADRIRKAHDDSRRRTLRFISYCEEALQKHDLPLTGEGSLQLLEVELYKRIDVVDREGGGIKERWQHCLAEIIMRTMEAEKEPKAEPKSNEKKKG